MEKPELLTELLSKWSEVVKQKPVSGDAQQRIPEQVRILDALLRAGCSQTPGGTWEGDSDVRFMLEDRKRVLRLMRDYESNDA